MRKWISLVLTLALLLPLLSVMGMKAQAAEEGHPLEVLVRQQYLAYAQSLGTPNASAGTSQLLKHAISGGGKKLNLGEKDPFTVAMLNSALVQESVTTAVWDGTVYMQARNEETLSMAGGLAWYRAGSGGWFALCPLETDGSCATINGTWDPEKRDTTMYYRASKSKAPLDLNSFDQMLINTVGGSRLTLQMWKTAVDAESVTYRVSLKMADGFNFDGDYSHSAYGDSTDALISKFGLLLSMGLIDPYDWESAVEFDITVPNTCSHGLGTRQWEFDGIRALPQENDPLNLIRAYRQDGTAYAPYYRVDRAVHLQHDRPWAVEMRVRGTASFQMGGVRNSKDGGLTLSRGGGYVDMIRSEVYYVQDVSNNSSQVRYHSHQYGVSYSKVYNSRDWHTFRVENRVNADGSNMVWLLVDGDELGPMEHYRFHEEKISEDRPNWFDGSDLIISYLKCSDFSGAEDLEIDYIQIWENGEGNAPYSYFETTTAAPSCTEPGKTVHTCSLCGASYSEETGEAALGHAWDDGVVTAPATCTTDGVLTYTCANDPSHTKTEPVPATGHSPVVDAAVSASCTADGLTEGSHCETCGEILTAQETVPALGHVWDEGSEVTKPTVNAPGTMMYTCTVCGELRGEEIPYESNVFRLAGGHRYETAFKAADQMKANLGIKKFDSVVVASGTNFADALSGSYLAAVKNAPILLACDVEWVNDLVKDYIYQNLNEDGTIYILGGEGAVPASFEKGLDDFEIERLAGGNRFETNLLVLEEAGVGDKPILVCTGLEFADSLSASATKLPILLVYGDKLLPDQTVFMEANQGRELYIIGGEGAVSNKLESALTAHGNIERVAGNNRFETSTLIAEKFFAAPESAVLAYAWDFPDGLCGGPLATTMNAPLLLTMANYEAKAADYIQTNAISNAIILGGEGLISGETVNNIFHET